MTIAFPAVLDDFTAIDPNAAGVTRATPVGGRTESQFLNDHGDAIEALEAKVGIDASSVATSLDRKVALRIQNESRNRFERATVMTTPPTVVLGTANAATVISGGVQILPTSASLRYSGCSMAVFNSTYWKAAGVTGGAQATIPFTCEWEFDGSEFEVDMRGSGTIFYRVWINDELATLAAQAGPGNTGGRYKLHVALGSRANRRIKFEASTNFLFAGIWVGPNDTVWLPARPLGPRAIFMGDSITMCAGAGGNQGFESYACETSRLMGWECWNSGLSGTGYLQDSVGLGFSNFVDRFTADVLNQSPKYVIFAGGYNDYLFTPAAVAAAATALWAQIDAHTQVVVLGVWASQQPQDSARAAVNTALQAAAASAGRTFINVDPWTTGVRSLGTGNAANYIYSDNIHPTITGQLYIGQRLAAALVALGF